MIQLAALFVGALTLPIWIGALSAVLAFGIQLLFNAPWLLLGIFLVVILANFL